MLNHAWSMAQARSDWFDPKYVNAEDYRQLKVGPTLLASSSDNDSVWNLLADGNF